MKNSPKHYQAGLLPIFFMAMGLVIWKNGGINAHGWGDYVMFGLFVLLMIWLLTPRRADKGTSHEAAPK